MYYMRKSPRPAAYSYSSIALNRRALFSLVGGATLGLMGACAKKIPPYRFRMTVEVETPEGLRSGSSVIEAGGFIESQLAPGEARGRSIPSVKGEAIVIPMPNNGMLFALMVSDRDAEYMASAALTAAINEPWYNQNLPPNEKRELRDQFLSKPREIPRFVRRTPSKIGLFDNYPIFVTFGNLGDPHSIKRVDPDNMSATFGNRVRLRRITVQLTNESVTHQIQRHLPWIDRADKFNFPPDFREEIHTFGTYRRFFVMEND